MNKKNRYKQTDEYNKEKYRVVFLRVKKTKENFQMIEKIKKDFGSINSGFNYFMVNYCTRK